MDGPTFDQSDLDRLSIKDKQELQQFITNEQQKARIQQRTRLHCAGLALPVFMNR